MCILQVMFIKSNLLLIDIPYCVPVVERGLNGALANDVDPNGKLDDAGG